MIAAGIAAGGWLASRYARERGLDAERLWNAVLLIAVAGAVGARIFYLAEQGDVLRPAEWVGSRGFSFYGAIILGTAAVGGYLWRAGLGVRYLDALAAGFPLGMAVGRIGDVINGEHHGPATDLPWGLRHTHPDADVPSAELSYHDGGLYEMALGLAMLAILWPLRERFSRPGLLLAVTVGLYSVGRFAMFFYRSDSDELALGLNSAQWTSLALAGLAGLIAWLLARRQPAGVNAERTPTTG